MPWQTMVLALGAVYRLTRLVTADYITSPIRRWAARGERHGEKVGYFITCPWCTSIWLAAAVAPVAVWWGDNRAVLAGMLALTASAFAGLVSQLDQSD